MLPGLQGTKKTLYLFALLFVLISSDVFAQFHHTAFWKRRGSGLKFTTTSQALYAGNCSGAVTIATFNANNAQTNVATNTTINIAGSGTTTFYSDSSCTTTITSMTITTGSSSGTIYFIDTGTGSNVITASATNYFSASQTETISTNPFIWTGGGANANWSTAANWSGGAAPGSSDIALFNGTCSSNCSPLITSNMTVGGIRMNSDFSGTITQNAGVTVTVNSGNWVQYAGNFVGGNSRIALNSTFNLLGGTFTSTTEIFVNYGGGLNFGASGVFTHNSGTFNMTIPNAASTWKFAGNPVFNHFYLTNGCYASVTSSGSITVNGTMTFDSGCGIDMIGGTINAKGDVTTSRDGATGTLALIINGSTNQLITGDTYSSGLPDTTIASTGGTVSITNIIKPGNFTYSSGTLNAGTSTIYFNDTNRVLTFTPGNSNNYYNVRWRGGCGQGFVVTGTLNVIGLLEFNSACPANISGAGTIHAKGDISVKGWGASASIPIIINGSGNQTIDGGSDQNVFTPYMEVASTGGAVTFTNTFSFTYGFKYLSGTVDASTSTFIFRESNNASVITPGSMEFGNVYWYGGCQTAISLSGTIVVKGTMTMGGNCPGIANGGKMLLYGNASINWAGGTSEIEFTGPTNTVLSQGSGTPTGNITVSKTGGATLTLSSNVSFNNTSQNFILTSGAVDMNAYNLTLKALNLNGNTLTKNAGILTVNGTVAGTGALYNGTVNP